MIVNAHIWDYLENGMKRGQSVFALRGGRRAGKTYTTCQFLLDRSFSVGDLNIFASMTQDQGSSGVYDDCKNIIGSNASWQPYFEILKSPREIHCLINRGGCHGKNVYRSYRDPETAKGGACDWAFINEANKFTLQQYYDIAANARCGVILDFNPNIKFWIDDIMPQQDELKVKWQWNKNHLTPAQLKWFQDIYDRAHRDGATAADWYYYKVYYEGEYCELQGSIFTPDNIRTCKPSEVPVLDMVVIFSDPSACCGADYHATVMAGLSRADGKIYILDTDSRNIGTEYDRAMLLQSWVTKYDRIMIYVETNGAIGQQFYNYCMKSSLPVNPFNSRANKIDRIMSNYQTITDSVVFVENDHLEPYLQQVYAFDGYEKKVEHDDNIDAVNSAVTILKPYLPV